MTALNQTLDLPQDDAGQSLAGSPCSLFLGDCLTVSKKIEDQTVTAVITDPPYGESMGFDGDANIDTALDLLQFASRDWHRILVPNGMVAVFWASRSVDQAIDTLKGSGLSFRRILNMYLPRGGARPYMAWLPRTQPILIFQKYMPKAPPEIHAEICDVLNAAIERESISKKMLADTLGCNSRLIMKWTRKDDPAWCLPTPRFWKPLKDILKLGDDMDFLLTREPARGPQREYEYLHDTYVVNEDINDKCEHPCQKPLRVIRHLCDSLAGNGDIILDPFMGSGTTGVAAMNTGRRFIGIEKDADFFRVASERISSAKTAKLSREPSANNP